MFHTTFLELRKALVLGEVHCFPPKDVKRENQTLTENIHCIQEEAAQNKRTGCY